MTPDLIIGTAALALLLVLESQLPFYLNRQQRLRHGLRNGGLALINACIAVLLAPLLVGAAHLSAQSQFGLLHWIEPMGVLGPLVATTAAILLFDLWMYGWHRANHRLPVLWRFHQVHHTDTAMDVTTALRFHPGELTLSSLANPIIVLLLGIGLAEVTLYKALMLPMILFHHSNVAIPARLEHQLRRWIVPPSLHRVHHSRIGAETNTNYGTLFPFWDRLFGSFRVRDDLERVDFGTGHRDDPSWQTLGKLLRLPMAPPRLPGREPGVSETSPQASA